MKRLLVWFAFVPLAFLTFSPPEVHAQSRSSKEQRQVIERLRELIRKAEQTRAADRWLLDDLRSLVRRYDRPWGVEVLRDDFSDGNYTRSPAWMVASGRFTVDRRVGLQSSVRAGKKQETSNQRQDSGDATSALIGAILDQALKKKRKTKELLDDSGHAEIYVHAPIPNSFSIRMDFGSRRKPGRLVFGPYDGRKRDRGYRLAYNPGDKRSLELYRATRSGTSRIASYHQPLNLEDGLFHSIEWTRDQAGKMTVSVDGKKRVEVSDTNLRGGFNGITVVNFDGEFVFREFVIIADR